MRSALALIFLLAPMTAVAADNYLADQMFVYDSVFLEDYSIALEAVRPLSVSSNTDLCTVTVRLTGNGTTQAYASEVASVGYSHEYIADARLNGYDENGNYLLNYRNREWIVMHPESWTMRQEINSKPVSPSGRAAGEDIAVKPLILHHHVGDDDMANLMYRNILPLGRGFAQLLREVTTVTVEAGSGALRVEATGVLFSPQPGKWRLEVDPKLDYLVRSAEFTPDGTKVPTFDVHTTGLVDAAMPIAAKGNVRFSDYRLSVRVLSYSRRTDEALIDQASALTLDAAERAVGTRVLDFREMDANYAPKMTRVK